MKNPLVDPRTHALPALIGAVLVFSLPLFGSMHLGSKQAIAKSGSCHGVGVLDLHEKLIMPPAKPYDDPKLHSKPQQEVNSSKKQK